MPSLCSIRAVPACSSSPNTCRRASRDRFRSTKCSPSTNCRCRGSRTWPRGIPGAQEWVNDLPNETNKKFVADYIEKYKKRPSFYGAQTYDAVSLLNSAVTAVNGDLSKKEEMRREMEKADFKSVRGNFKFGNNHIPIQNFYLQDVVKQGDDYVLKTVATIVENDQDRFHDRCPMKLGQ